MACLQEAVVLAVHISCGFLPPLLPPPFLRILLTIALGMVVVVVMVVMVNLLEVHGTNGSSSTEPIGVQQNAGTDWIQVVQFRCY